MTNFMEYFTDTTFVLIMLIGGMIAIFYAFMQKSKKKKIR